MRPLIAGNWKMNGLTAKLGSGGGQAPSVIRDQIAGSVPEGTRMSDTAIAYEPLWAIGSRRTPPLAEVVEMHAHFRALLVMQLGAEGKKVRIGADVTREAPFLGGRLRR